MRRKWDWLIVLAVFLVGQLVWTHFLSNQDKLCTTLVGIVERSDKSIRAHPYYVEHPEQLQAALDQNNETLRDLRDVCP